MSLVDNFQLPSGPCLRTGWLATANNTNLDLEIQLVVAYLASLATARNFRSGLLRLPAELLDIIFDDVYDGYGPSSMRACALVCRHLVAFAHARLFSSIRVSTPHECVKAMELAKSRPDLCALVRKAELWDMLEHPDNGSGLSWHEDCVDQRSIKRFFSSLGRVEVLHVKRIRGLPDTLNSHECVLSLPRHSFKHLILEDCDFEELSEFDELVSAFTRLETLKLVDVNVDEIVDSEQFPFTIQVLPIHTLSINTGCSSNLLSWFHEYINPRTLRSLDCTLPLYMVNSAWGIAEHWDEPADFFRDVGVVLETARFTSESLREVSIATAALSQTCPNLRELTIAQGWPLPSIEELKAVLNAMGQIQMEVATLTRTSNSMFGLPINLDMVVTTFNHILRRPSFSALQTFHLQFGRIAKYHLSPFLEEVSTNYQPYKTTTCKRQLCDRTIVTTTMTYDFAKLFGHPERPIGLHITTEEYNHHYHDPSHMDFPSLTLSFLLGPLA